jgi:(1->4)-alpha-D-glucan 1-alpha-D-glucosylmutase
MSTYERLRHLADRYGLAPGFHDLAGTWHAPGEAVLRQVLSALNVGIETDAAITASIHNVERVSARELLAPVACIRQGNEAALRLDGSLTGKHAFSWQIQAEGGALFDGSGTTEDLAKDTDGHLWWTVPVELAPGYHELSFNLSDQRHATCRLIVTPAKAFQPQAVLGSQRGFGIMLQLYSVASADNWGIGDFRDVRNAINVFAPLGADFIGLNPLHAGFLGDPARCSPYSPSNRRLLNPLYLAVDELEDFRASSAARSWLSSTTVQARLESLRSAALVDYVKVADLKLEACEFAYRQFLRTSDDEAGQADFAAFRTAHGTVLEHHAAWEATGWHSGVRAVPEFFIYLQWQTARALDALARHARAMMKVGLYLDLAVGVTSDGGEAQSVPSLFAHGVSLGAPPDDFSPTGQNWTLPPWNPHALRAAAYQPFVQMLRSVMSAGGALRIDHVVGLLRQFWIPDGKHAGDGVYIQFPVRDLLAIIALESHRHRCVVVGEDLGTVPDEMRTLLNEHGLLSYRVLYFERYWHGDHSFKKPWDFPADALVTIATHDLPTLAGYFSSHDLRLRAELGKLPPATDYAQQRTHREWECALLRRTLAEESLDAKSVACAVHTYVAQTPCRLMAVQIEDLLGIEDQVNLPDTIDEHPNWRRRLPVPLQAWAEQADIVDTCAAIREARSSSVPG